MFEKRLVAVRQRMAETKTDMIVVGPSSHLQWLTGLSPHGDERPVMLIVSRHGAAFLMPAVNMDSQRPLTPLPFFTWEDSVGPGKALLSLLAGVAPIERPLRVALDETMRADFALLVMNALPTCDFTFLHETVGQLRAHKSETEFHILKANALLNDEAMRAGFACLREGISEVEVARVIRSVFERQGVQPEFIDICFGENGTFPHHLTSDRRICNGDVVMMDIGGRKDNYASDMTRMGVFGNAPETFEEVVRVVDAAVTAAVEAARPGVRARDVDAAARAVIVTAGYGPHFPHRTGHGLGIDVHEPPYIAANSDAILEEGHVFSIEPGLYFKNAFGVRLEEIVMIRNGKAQILSNLPRDVFRITPA